MTCYHFALRSNGTSTSLTTNYTEQSSDGTAKQWFRHKPWSHCKAEDRRFSFRVKSRRSQSTFFDDLHLSIGDIMVQIRKVQRGSRHSTSGLLRILEGLLGFRFELDRKHFTDLIAWTSTKIFFVGVALRVEISYTSLLELSYSNHPAQLSYTWSTSRLLQNARYASTNMKWIPQ